MTAGTACRDDARRGRVRKARLNGLDFLEVSDDQRRLTVHFLGKAPDRVERGNVLIGGGRRIRDIRVREVTIVREADPELDDRMLVELDRPGDWSTYTLRMVEADRRGHPTDERLEEFDARYATLDFAFKAGCPSPLDCAPAPCPPPAPDTAGGPPSYLARDYESFRQLMLDRLSLVLPDWKEQHVPDVGIALVELMAYVGDNLAYYQDAVGTEAYLETARLRTSVRRHLRLVDYTLHEGCNARAWVHVGVDDRTLTVPRRDLFFVTAWQGMPGGGAPLSEDDLRQVPRERYEVFEPVPAHGRTLAFHRAHNQISLYSWGRGSCCLPRGSTSATLLDGWANDAGGERPGQQPPVKQTPVQQLPGNLPAREQVESGEKEDGILAVDTVQTPPAKGDVGQRHPVQPDNPHPPARKGSGPERVLRLRPGDLLLLEERIGPWTGEPADADPGHRHVVRLTRVTPTTDELDGTPVLEVEWHPADALPFELCISGIGRPPACEELADISVARGNVVLVDHGETVFEEAGTVQPLPVEPDCGECGCPPRVVPGALAFSPALRQTPLTWTEPLDWKGPASAAVAGRDPVRALPAAAARFAPAPVDERGPEKRARRQPRPPVWRPRPDLLGSWPGDRHFVVETDGGVSTLRFGDGDPGDGPDAGAACTVRYRVGNGLAGNVGAGAIAGAVRRGGEFE
ncbi:MAG TPA: hypothetical protein VE913_17795, partial [Longimicrobium sp.]|nr:hypothetical protein [Longimicrobium sp.]